MRQKFGAVKQLNIPISVIIIAVILVVSITAVNVLVVRNSVKEMINDSMEEHLQDVAIGLDELLDRMYNKADTVKDIVFEAESEKELIEVLEEIDKTSALYSFFYLTKDGILYDGHKSINPSEYNFKKILKLRSTLFVNDYYSYCQAVNTNDPNNIHYMVIGVYRKTNEDGDAEGYFITALPMEDLISEDEFEHVDETAAACLMDEDGTVYIASDKYNERMKNSGNPGNAYEAALWLTDGSVVTQSKFTQMQRYLNVNKTYSITCKGKDGKQILVKGGKVRGATNLFLFAIYDNGIMDEQMMPVILVCFVCCMAIVAVLFLIILLQMMINYQNIVNIEILAYTDEVTGGYNLNYFKFKAPELIDSNLENHYVITRFDIANFRYLNEAYGHLSADEILRNISEQFEKIYSKKELCARINSDQFIALILNDAEMDDKNRKFEKNIGDMAKEAGVKYPIRFKRGIYKVRKEDSNIDIMIDHANAARKSLKGDEKTLEVLYSENIAHDMKKLDTIESEMQPALNRGEFKAYLQPKWDIVEDHIIGGEILVRWIKPDGSMVYPSDFVPIFEQNGFVERLDFYMLEKLCEKIREYKQKGNYNLVPISINQSRILLGNPEYLKNVERIMNRYDTAIEDIQIEITESVFFNDREKMIMVIDQLKEMGLTLCMDDFGSGYSSLNLLKDIPFDILKIDKDFFSEAETSRDTVIIMKHIVGMAEELGIKVVCEGVETEKQIKMLKEIGCKMVQGYYYSKPIPFDEFMDRYLLKDAPDESAEKIGETKEEFKTETKEDTKEIVKEEVKEEIKEEVKAENTETEEAKADTEEIKEAEEKKEEKKEE